MRSRLLLALVLLLGLVPACGDNLPGAVDATADGAADALPRTCELAAALGSLTPVAFDASFVDDGGGAGPSSYSIDNVLTSDPVFDVISLELYADHGVFAGGFPTTFPVAYTLSGDELDYATCGACVRAFGDVSMNQWEGEYFATAGTVTLLALSTTRITGTLTDLTLVHVQKDRLRTMPLGDGCTTTVAGLAFDAVPTTSFTGRSARAISGGGAWRSR